MCFIRLRRKVHAAQASAVYHLSIFEEKRYMSREQCSRVLQAQAAGLSRQVIYTVSSHRSCYINPVHCLVKRDPKMPHSFTPFHIEFCLNSSGLVSYRLILFGIVHVAQPVPPRTCASTSTYCAPSFSFRIAVLPFALRPSPKLTLSHSVDFPPHYKRSLEHSVAVPAAYLPSSAAPGLAFSLFFRRLTRT